MKETLIQKIVQGLKDMCYIWAKEMRSTVTDEGVFIFFVLVPILYPLLYSWIYNNETVHEVPVVVVDNSRSHLSRQFLRQYDAAPGVQIVGHCTSLDEARQQVGKQAARGIVYIPSDFETRVNRMEQSVVSVYSDMSLMLYYKAIYQTAVAVSSDINSKIQINLAGNVTTREDQIHAQPLAYDEVALFNPTAGYGSFVIPAVLILIIQQTLLLGIGLAAGTARESNRYQDLVPMSRQYHGIFRIVLGKALCYFMIYAVLAAYLTLVVPRMFHFTALPRPDALLAVMIPYLLSCIFFGLMLSCVVRYRENVILLVVFTSIPLLFLSGVSWPESAMPGPWKAVAWLFPSTFGVRAFVRINSMGATLADVQQEYQALWLQVLAYFFMACLVYRYQIISARQHAAEKVLAIKEKIQQAKSKKTDNASTD